MAGLVNGDGPLPLEAFLRDPDAATARPGGLAWGGLVAGAGASGSDAAPRRFTTPPRGSSVLPPLPGAAASGSGSGARPTKAAEQDARLAALNFRASLPTGRHLFFLDSIRPLEHFFAVTFSLSRGEAGNAFFAFNDANRRVRRAVNLDRDALTHAFKKQEGPTASASCGDVDANAWRLRLEEHLKSKHYPETSAIEYIGTGHMATLGELYIHSSREDLVREVEQDIRNSKKKGAASLMSSLDSMDLDLMLDVLSIKSSPSNGNAAALGHVSPRDGSADFVSAEEASHRPTTAAATVLVFDSAWNIVNGDAIQAGLSDTSNGAISLEQSGARPTQLWLDDDRIRAKWGGDANSYRYSASAGPSAPDPGFFGSEAADMVLSSAKGVQRDWCGAVLEVAEYTLKHRVSSKYR